MKYFLIGIINLRVIAMYQFQAILYPSMNFIAKEILFLFNWSLNHIICINMGHGRVCLVEAFIVGVSTLQQDHRNEQGSISWLMLRTKIQYSVLSVLLVRFGRWYTLADLYWWLTVSVWISGSTWSYFTPRSFVKFV